MKVFTSSDKGLVRQSNQDSCAGGVLDESSAWAAVFDGMGGANAGDFASAKALQTVTEKFLAGYNSKMSCSTVRNLLECAISAANQAVFECSQSDPMLSGMGTTVVIAVAHGDDAVIAHAGDSRAYLISAGGSCQLTSDHSVVQAMVDCGQITAEEAAVHPRRNVITRALGVSQELDIDFCECGVNPGDMLLLCSDGLSNYITLDEIADVAERIPVGELADELVAMANDRGGADNITVTIIYVDSEEEVSRNG